MNKKDTLDRIKLFSLANSMAEHKLDQIETDFDINLKRVVSDEVQRKEFYLQFDAEFRKEAKSMAEHYEVFYCLEKSIRRLIMELMEEEFGANWWEEKVPQAIRDSVEANIKREEDSGFTIRSEEKIDYTTFGELTQIVTGNWQAFDDLFKRGQRSFQRIMANLNQLRGPIAHCAPLAPDEIVRLELTVKDWFRLME